MYVNINNVIIIITVREGGLGVRRVASLALPAFLASAVSTQSLQESILSTTLCPPDTIFDRYLARWSSSFGMPPLNEQSHKQSAWERLGLLLDRNTVETSLVEARQKASFLAASSQHSGDWLAVLPIASCGLRLDDEAVRVAVALRLGMNLCTPHACRCGSQVDARGLHAFVCKFAPGKFARHQAINEVISRAFASAQVPATKEPTGLSRSDGRRPDGMTLTPWQNGKGAFLPKDPTRLNSFVEMSRTVAVAAFKPKNPTQQNSSVELKRL